MASRIEISPVSRVPLGLVDAELVQISRTKEVLRVTAVHFEDSTLRIATALSVERGGSDATQTQSEAI